MTGPPHRVLVTTVVHRPEDARIRHRQIAALRAAGWQVTYAAPFSGHGQPPPGDLRTIDLPRAAGRRRLAALLAARRLLRREGRRHDVVLLHDPELLLALPFSGVRHVVWDVHEDPVAAIGDRDWVPGPLRGVLRAGLRVLERWGEHRCTELLLAERSYQSRFRRPHPVVLNLPVVPADPPPLPGEDRVVYVGRLSTSRGARELVALGDQLADDDVTVELVGYADDDVAALLADADARGVVRWRGFIPNDEALATLDGATAGLSLLHDQPNFRGSMPTKVVEYLAHGLPVVTTPLPEAVAIVEGPDLGTVVPFGDVDAAAAAVRALVADPARRRDVGERAWAHARARLDWRDEADVLTTVLASVAAQ